MIAIDLGGGARVVLAPSPTREHDLGGGARLVLPPAEPREEDARDLPRLDVSGVPGARVVARRGFRDGDRLERVACVRAPSDRWAPGVESLVLERATGIAAATMPEVGAWSGGEVRAAGPRFEQTLEAQSSTKRAAMRHILGFVADAGAAPDVVACTLTCVEPASSASAACRAWVDGARAEGAFVSAPPPGLGTRAIFAGAERPYHAAALAAVVSVSIVAWILARRPRPRR